MKKNYTTPSLKVDFFHTESVLHTSSVGPTNAERAKSQLQVGMNDYENHTQLGIFDIFLD